MESSEPDDACTSWCKDILAGLAEIKAGCARCGAAFPDVARRFLERLRRAGEKDTNLALLEAVIYVETIYAPILNKEEPSRRRRV